MLPQMKSTRAFKGVNESIAPELLADDVLTVMENAVLDDEEGVATARKVFGTYGSQVAGTPRSLDEVSINGTDYLVAGIDNASSVNFMKSNGGTGAWASVKSGLTTGKRLRLAVYNQQVVATNGSDAPFISDLSSNFNLALPQPDISGLSWALATTGGNMPHASQYLYAFVFVASDGSLSQPSLITLAMPSGISWTGTDYPRIASIGNNPSTDTNTLTAASLPTTNDTRITQIWIFRSQQNKPVLYYLDEVPAGTTSYVDTHADTDLDTSTSLTAVNTPTGALYILQHKDRIFLGNLSKGPSTIFDTANALGFPTSACSIAGTGLTAASTYLYGITFILADGTETAMYLPTGVEGITPSATGPYSVPLQFMTVPFLCGGGATPDANGLSSAIKEMRVYRTTGQPTFLFTCTAGTTAPQEGDVYSNNGAEFMIAEVQTGTGWTILAASTGTPTASGTLTKVSGSGDSTIAFSAETGSPFSYDVPFYLLWRFTNSLNTATAPGINPTTDPGSIGYVWTQMLLSASGIADTTWDALLDTYPQFSPTGATALSSAVVWSEPESIQQFSELNIQLVAPDDGNPITGLVDDSNGVLIFKQGSIYKLFTTGTQPAGLYQVAPNIGSDQPNSIINAMGTIFFVSRNQIYSFISQQGANPIPVSQNMRNTCASVTSWNSVAFSKVYQYVIWNVTIGSDEWLLILDLKSKDFARFYKWKVTPATFVLERQTGADAQKLVVAGEDTDGYVKLGYYQVGTTDSWVVANAAPIQRVRTKTFNDGGIALMAPRKIWIEQDVADCSLTQTLFYPTTGDWNSAAENNGATESEVVLLRAGAMGINGKTVPRFYFEECGTGLQALRGIAISYIPIKRGSRG